MASTLTSLCPAATVGSGSSLRLILPIRFDPELLRELATQVRDLQLTVGKAGAPKRIWADAGDPPGELLPHLDALLRKRAVRLTLRPDPGLRRTGLGGEWCVVGGAAPSIVITDPEPPPNTRITWRGADLILLPVGVGFLSLTAEVKDRHLTEWTDTLHLLRVATGARAHLRARRRTGRDRWEGLLPGRAADGSSAWAANTLPSLATFLLGPQDRTADPDQPEGTHVKLWQSAYVADRWLLSGALFVEDVAKKDQYPVRYAISNAFNSRQPLRPTAPVGELELVSHHEMPYVDAQSFLTTLELSMFVAFDRPPGDFFEHQLPNHLANEYALAYTLALAARFSLLELMSAVPVSQSDDATAIAKFRALVQRFLAFSAQGYERQVMQRDHQHQYFETCQRALGVPDLFEDVRALIAAVEVRLEAGESKRRENHQRRLERGFVFLLAVPAVVLGFLGMNIDGLTVQKGGLDLTATFVVGGVMASVLILGSVLLLWGSRDD